LYLVEITRRWYLQCRYYLRKVYRGRSVCFETIEQKLHKLYEEKVKIEQRFHGYKIDNGGGGG
jgi:hypothetical protein